MGCTYIIALGGDGGIGVCVSRAMERSRKGGMGRMDVGSDMYIEYDQESRTRRRENDVEWSGEEVGKGSSDVGWGRWMHACDVMVSSKLVYHVHCPTESLVV